MLAALEEAEFAGRRNVYNVHATPRRLVSSWRSNVSRAAGRQGPSVLTGPPKNIAFDDQGEADQGRPRIRETRRAWKLSEIQVGAG